MALFVFPPPVDACRVAIDPQTKLEEHTRYLTELSEALGLPPYHEGKKGSVLVRLEAVEQLVGKINLQFFGEPELGVDSLPRRVARLELGIVEYRHQQKADAFWLRVSFGLIFAVMFTAVVAIARLVL